MRAEKLSAVATSLLLVAMCAGCFTTKKLYEGPVRPLEETAVLLEDPNGKYIDSRYYRDIEELRRVYINTVDGKTTQKSVSFAFSGPNKILLLPGSHTITIGICIGGWVHEQAPQFTFVAEAGMTYFVTAEVDLGRRKFRPIIKGFPHSVAKLGKAVWKWEPAIVNTAWTEVEFPAGAALDGEGSYEVEFRYTGGAHALAIEWVAVTVDGVEFARDTHLGQTGRGSKNNVYEFMLGPVSSGAKYGIRARIKSTGGQDSCGVVAMRKARTKEVPIGLDNRPKPGGGPVSLGYR